MKKRPIQRIENRESKNLLDWVEEEIKLRIILNDTEYSNLYYSGNQAAELSIGLIFMQHIIHHRVDIKSLEVDGHLVRVETSPCGEKMKNPPFDFSLKPEHIFSLMKTFHSESVEFQRTGGRHSAAIADAKKCGPRFSDISRHNAVLKLIGYALINDIPLSNKAILLSCRVTAAIAEKLVSAGAGVIITNAAVSAQGIDVCRTAKATLAGFVRGQRMNLYFDTNRIEIS